MKNMEIWKPIKDFENLYEVSNFGRVKSLNYRHTEKERILKPSKSNNDGYLQVCLTKDKKTYCKRIHRLVAEAFIPNPNNYREVNHKNENKTDNRIENIEWCDRTYNINYGDRNSKMINNRKGKTAPKEIIQYTKEGIIINKWNSISDINKQLGYSTGNISACCSGKRNTSYNCKWEYA